MRWHWYHYLKIWLLLVLLYIIYYLLDSPNDVVVKIATIAGPIIALGGLGFIGWQLSSNASQAKRQKTFDLATKYHEPEFFDRAFKASTFLASELQPSEKVERFFNKDNPYYIETRLSCGLLFNFYEDMSLMYNMDLVDKEVFVRSFGGTVGPAFQASKPLIEEYRKREQDDRLFIEWEDCAKDVEFRLTSKDAKS